MKTTAAFLKERPFLIFVLFLLAAYLPVFLPFFHIKNDLITQNLPTRFVISESLYSGHFPWWNPYINFGNPQYGDMNGGYWNPFLWLIAKTIGYNIWSITLEEMFYVLIGGYGIYLLCKEWGIARSIAVLTGLSYMSSGFILGHLQHFVWITGTAFFPYVLFYFIRIHKDPILKNFILGAGCTMLFLSSTHPGLVIGALYFFLFLFIGIYWTQKETQHKQFWSINALFLIITLLFSTVILTSNIDVLQHISRGRKVAIGDALQTPTPIPAYISLLFPLTVQSSTFSDSDIAMRNTWIGLFGLMGLLLFLRYSSKKYIALTSFTILFFILLSAGGGFGKIAYHLLPLTGYVRLSGEFSYFVGLTMLLAGAIGIHKYYDPSRRAALLKSISQLNLLALAVSILLIGIKHDSVLYQHHTAGDWKQQIKTVLDGLSCWDLLLLQSLLSGATLLLLFKTSPTKPAPSNTKPAPTNTTTGPTKINTDPSATNTTAITTSAKATNTTAIIIAANLILTCWLILPFTGLGMASKANRQQLISTFPKGIHAQELSALNNTRFLDTIYLKDLILLGSYTKKIGYPAKEAYPIVLNTADDFFSDSTLTHFIFQQSWLFLSKDTITGTPTRFDSSVLHINTFAPGRLDVTITNTSANPTTDTGTSTHTSATANVNPHANASADTGTTYRYLTFLQNDYPYWKIKLDGRPIAHFTGFRSFLTIPLPPAPVHRVEYIFDPTPIRTALLINLLFLLLAAILLSIKKTRSWRPFAPPQQPR